MNNVTASVRTLRPAAASCPSWCEREHSTTYVTHTADVAELENADGSTVVITLSQHLQPGYVGERVVRVYTCMGGESTIADLPPHSAEALGRSIVAFSPDESMRAYGLALRRAAAHLLLPGLARPRTEEDVPATRLGDGSDIGPATAESHSQEKLFRIAFLSGYLNVTKAPPILDGGVVEHRLSQVLSPRETGELCDIVRGMLTRRADSAGAAEEISGQNGLAVNR
ncbi:hypothetical protein [Streptosporangium sp. 'caverna']|uniref:hypothetical protein n=1 Tax=Streptosporangium sp. 'caverna' TaxID=2202249 RepID=UPI000D7E0D16|nr:hypothetical protein [Streptosporangium sp. 'caverna']AWS45961.1 hypothetical protein DKM19_36355 [Streptosporangium sp. 'caverna']